jgi:hypothetical protein
MIAIDDGELLKTCDAVRDETWAIVRNVLNDWDAMLTVTFVRSGARTVTSEMVVVMNPGFAATTS